MTDTDKLKRLAELGRKSNVGIVCVPPDCEDILALIAENERLKKRNLDRAAFLADAILDRDEAVALLRDVCGSADIYEDLPLRVAIDIDDFLARIDAVTKPVA